MSSAQRLELKKADAQRRWQQLSSVIERLQAQRDLETRAEEQLRLDSVLSQNQAERAEVERELDQLERLAARPDPQALLLRARTQERKQAYAEALALWRQMSSLGWPDAEAQAEIARLSALHSQSERRRTLLQKLAPFLRDIAPVFKSVSDFLAQSDLSGAEPAQLLIEQLCAHSLDPATFVAMWQALHADKPPTVVAFDFSSHARRLQRGELALFLGADLPHLFEPGYPSAKGLAQALAAEVQLATTPAIPSYSLSAVAEYFQMASAHGRPALVRGLQSRLPTALLPNPLHALLSQTQAPLLVLCAGHDSLLETAWQLHGKRYVVVTSVVAPVANFHPGQVLLQYCDRPQPEPPMLGENLSHESILEAGYSLIFKLRGTYPMPGRMGGRDQCSLVLSERSHFDFARLLDRILPDYLKTQLGSLGLWFLGFAPEQWEDRLLASAVLDGRRSAEPAIVVADTLSQFEAAFWASRGVQQQPFALPDFVAQLQRASS